MVLNRVNKKYIVSIIGLIELLIGYLAFCVATIAYKDNWLVYLTIILFGIVSIIYFVIFATLSSFSEFRNVFKEIHIVNISGGILCFCLVLRDLQNVHFLGYQKIVLLLFMTTTLIGEGIYLKQKGLSALGDLLGKLVRMAKDHVGVLFVLFLFLLLSIYSGGTPYKWDSRLYYVASQDLNAFSISNLALYGHTAQTVGLFIKIGTVLSGSVSSAVYVMNVLVAIVGIFSFYGILLYVYPQSEKNDLLLATGAYAFSAYILGLVNYFSLDYYCASLFPAVLYFMLTHKWIFYVVFSYLFCFTKEPAIIIYAGVCIAYFFVKEVPVFQQNGLRSIIIIFTRIQYWYMAMVGILWYATYKLLGPWSAGEGGIEFDISFVWERFKVMYLMNFGWYFSALCLLAIMVKVLGKRNHVIYSYLLIPLFAFTIFNCIFKTANHYRYNAVIFFAICSISMIYVLSWSKRYIRQIVLGISCIISLCSSHFSIDPVSNWLFNSVFTGNGYIWSTSEDSRLGDSAIYNKQMLWMENALNRCLKDAINQGDSIILQAQQDNLWYADGLTDFLTLEKGGFNYYFLWDDKLSQRVNMVTDTSRSVEIFQVQGIEDIEQVIGSTGTQQTYSYISIADTDNEVFSQITNRFHVTEEEEYSYANWKYRRIQFQETEVDDSL